MAHCYLLERITRSLRGSTRKYAAACFTLAAMSLASPEAVAQQQLPFTAQQQSPFANPRGAVAARAGVELDPLTLEPVAYQVHQPGTYPGTGFDGVHPVVENWRTPRGPRYPSIYKEALKQSLAGWYGGIEYLNLNISTPSNRVFGNYTDLPDFNDPNNAGYVLPFSGGDEQPLRGTLNPGQPVIIDAALVDYAFDTIPFDTDHAVASPFFDTTTVANNLAVIDTALVFLNQPGANLLGPDFSLTQFDENNAIRGILGYQFANGVAIEINVLDIGESNSRLAIDGDLRFRNEFDGDATNLDLQTPDRQNITYVPIVLTDVTLDLPTDLVGALDLDGDTNDLAAPLLPLYYDGGFAFDYDIDVNSSDATLYFPVPTNYRRWSFDWLFGARYLNVEQALTPGLTTTNALGEVIPATAIQVRALPDATTLTAGTNLTYQLGLGFPEIGDPRTTNISADVENNTYAAQFGFRTELDLDFVTLGVAPKLALGVNHAEALVSTSQLLRANDTATLTTRDSWEDFAAVLDLGVYAKINLRDWCRATVGYQVMYSDTVAHAPDVLDFRVSSTNPAIGVQQRTEDLLIQGVTVGLEIFYP